MRQQTTNLPQTLTPLERLLHEKQRVTEECELRKIKLNADCAYIQAHAGSLLLSGLSALLFPGGNKKQTAKASANQTAAAAPAMPWGWGDLLAVGKGLLPVAWEVAQPIIMTWGIKKVRKWFSRLLFSKKE
ncbi:hypothetical protein JQM84_10215 [Parabacteroides distasonis]|nr:hypothetical protein [Parabacteroides distasonis]